MKLSILIVCLFVLSLPATAISDCLACPSAANPGPTLNLGYVPEAQGNTVDSFMYFVPLVCPGKVMVFTDPNNTFTAKVISHSSSRRDSILTTQCIFVISGAGLYEAVLDIDDMIAFNTKHTKAPKTMRNLLESIHVEKPFTGRLDVQAKEVGGQLQIQNFSVRFDLAGKSPVSASLYEIPYLENAYLSKNMLRTRRIRVNAMNFTVAPGKPPVMGVEVGAISPIGKEDSLLSSLKAFLANCLLPEIPIPDLGGQTMADFGVALVNRKETFTFPLAQNLRLSLTAWVQQQTANGSISN